MKIVLKVVLAFVVILTTACTILNKSSETLSEEEIMNQPQEFCLGFLESGIYSYYQQNSYYPDDLDFLFNRLYEIKPNCFYSSHLRYQLLDKQTYIIQYIGDDAEFDTNDDYYFFPNSNRNNDPYHNPDNIENAKKEGDEYLQGYCADYLATTLEEHWRVFDYYPVSLTKVNHPSFQLLYPECFKNDRPSYIYYGPQKFKLQFPGVDGKLDTEDDRIFMPHYGKEPINLQGRDIRDIT